MIPALATSLRKHMLRNIPGDLGHEPEQKEGASGEADIGLTGHGLKPIHNLFSNRSLMLDCIVGIDTGFKLISVEENTAEKHTPFFGLLPVEDQVCIPIQQAVGNSAGGQK